jgi:hypothetical protein
MNFSVIAPSIRSDTISISVTEAIGDTLCIASEDGQKVFEQILAAFKQDKKVVLSFKNGEDLTRAFLSDAIAQLYEHFPDEYIRDSLTVIDIDPEDGEYIEDVIYWRKRYLEDPERFKKAVQESLGYDDE